MATQQESEPTVDQVDGSGSSVEARQTIDIVNPATGEVAGQIQVGNREDAANAVAAAKAAGRAWAALSSDDRTRQVLRVLDAIESHKEELAAVQTVEMGQPVDIAVEELEYTVKTARANIAAAEHPSEVKLEGGSLVYEPRGVAALIVPWNFPLPIAFDCLVPLLVTGNTVIWKPSERSPLSAVAAMRVIGPLLPEGVLNLLVGDGGTGHALVSEPDVSTIVFTGSVEAGRSVAVTAAKRFAKVVLELGGKDPAIVDGDVDPVWAAEKVADAAFYNSGQVCTSAERIYVHRDIAEAFTAALAANAAKTTLGPLVDRRQLQAVEAQVDAARVAGARVVVGGRAPDADLTSFYPATVLTGVPADAEIMREETFGPIAPIEVVESFDQAIELANATDFGLAATVYTNSQAHAELAARELRAGFVWINDRGFAQGARAEPQRLSGLGSGFGLGLWDEVRTVRYVHNAALPPEAVRRR